jgi:hypothetical protein
MTLKKNSLALGIYLATAISACASEGDWWPINPKVKWLYLSSGIYLDRWGGGGASGNDFSWHAKNRSLNPPQTLTSISAGGSLALTRCIGLSLSMPFFYNTFEEYSDRFGGLHPTDSRSGLGDFDIGIPIKIAKVTMQPQLSIPGPYDTKYLAPWTGFGVYRGGLGISYPWLAHSIWVAGETVLHKPSGENSGMVEEGDFAVKGGYGYKLKLNPQLQVKGGMDLAYTSFRWQPTAKAQTTFTADPKVSFSVSPHHGQELSLSASGSLYSTQGGEPDFRSYASRRIFFGAYYGVYF